MVTFRFLQAIGFRLRDFSRKKMLFNSQNLKTLLYVHFSFSHFQLGRGDTGFQFIVIYKVFLLKKLKEKHIYLKKINTTVNVYTDTI